MFKYFYRTVLWVRDLFFGSAAEPLPDDKIEFERLPDVLPRREVPRRDVPTPRHGSRWARAATPPLSKLGSDLADASSPGISSPTTSTSRRGSPILLIDLTVILIGMTLMTSPFSVVSAQATFQTSPHNSTMHLMDKGNVVFSTKSAILHLKINPYELHEKMRDTLTSFMAMSTLTSQDRVSQLPFCNNCFWPKSKKRATPSTNSENP